MKWIPHYEILENLPNHQQSSLFRLPLQTLPLDRKKTASWVIPTIALQLRIVKLSAGCLLCAALSVIVGGILSLPVKVSLSAHCPSVGDKSSRPRPRKELPIQQPF